ncbi:hypothetical protein HBI58_031670 [Parastagonospora nodorum]|nr:hypothetical protein HBI58_031670 [Parastagonospora nodorum]
MLQIYYIVSKEYKKLATRLRIIEIKNYAKRNSTIFITRDYTIIKLIRLTKRLQKYICIANARCIVRGLENSASASLLIYSNYALQEYSLLTLIGTVLYNAIKEYHNNRTRKTIYFYSYTIENNYNAIYKKSNVTVLDDYHDNDVNNILIKYIDNKQQQYNILIEDYNRAGKQEDNIFTIDKCRTSHSNKEDIEANERENKFTILAEEYIIDNCIIYALALTKDE